MRAAVAAMLTPEHVAQVAIAVQPQQAGRAMAVEGLVHRGQRMLAETLRDTIAAIATPAGRGGIGIVRVSGPGVPRVAAALLGRLPLPRLASFGPIRDRQGETIDEGLALYFPAPHSYTGEAVLELSGAGEAFMADYAPVAATRTPGSDDYAPGGDAYDAMLWAVGARFNFGTE